ncbi:MAG TPA: BTAD domain-containing putative transcriptional regulator [Acidimicrobiales bacterium]
MGVRFEPPVLGRACLVRERLLERLDGRFTHRVTVVSAPAGMGKTTLLAQAVEVYEGSDRRIDRWLSCGPDDAAASRLAEGLCQAVGAPPVVPLTPGAAVDVAVDAIVEAIWHRSPAEVCLVLDDVHEIPAGSSGADLLARLVAALPGNGHVVLAGRGAPPVPLARLEVRGAVVRIGEPDLLFTPDEVEAFAAQRGVAAERVEGCAGWPALSELAAAALPQVEAAYLWEEVLARLPEARRRDLALLAQIGPFDEELARAVLGHDVTVAELTADLPLVTATSTGGWQIHALWRPHLAGAVDDAAVSQARRRAGQALALRGDLAAAARQLAAAEAWDDLAALVTGALGAAHPPPPGDVVASWLGRLPDHLAQGPLGRLLAAVLDAPRHPSAAVDELTATAEAFRAAGDVAGELASMGQMGQLAWWAEDPALMHRLVLRLFELEAEGVADAVPLACVGRALIADLAADSHRVLAELDRIPPSWLRGPWVSMVEWLRAMAFYHLGRPVESLEAATRAHAEATPLLAPVIESTQLQARWYLGETAPAIEGLPRLTEWAVGTGMRDNACLMAAGTAMLYAAVGRVDEAVRYADLARRTGATTTPLVDTYLVIADATIAVARRDEDRAARALADHLTRYPVIDAGVAASAHRRSLPLWYVLAPATRAVWDAADLGGCFDHARRVAAALVAVREGRLAKGRLPGLGEVRLVPTLLPVPWAVELALAYAAVGRPEGPALLEAMWPAAQAEVRHHADPSSSGSPSVSSAGSSSGSRRSAPGSPSRSVSPADASDLSSSVSSSASRGSTSGSPSRSVSPADTPDPSSSGLASRSLSSGDPLGVSSGPAGGSAPSAASPESSSASSSASRGSGSGSPSRSVSPADTPDPSPPSAAGGSASPGDSPDPSSPGTVGGAVPSGAASAPSSPDSALAVTPSGSPGPSGSSDDAPGPSASVLAGAEPPGSVGRSASPPDSAVRGPSGPAASGRPVSEPTAAVVTGSASSEAGASDRAEPAPGVPVAPTARSAELAAALAKAARSALARLPVPPTARLDLRLLGPAVELRRDGELVDAPEWRRERVRSLLAHLAVHRPALRERVALDLWPDLDGEAQSRNLRVTLTHLLRVLEPERAERDASFLVRVHGARLELHGGEWLDVDLWRFDAAAARATAADREGRPPAALAAMREALSLWQGDGGELELFEWAGPVVEERRRQLVGLASRAAELLLARGEPEEARAAATVALTHAPWEPRAQHILSAVGAPP